MKRKISGILILVIFSVSFCLAAENPKETELLFMAKKAYEDGFYEVSLGMLERFGKDFKGSAKAAEARLLSGQCYFNQGRYLEALNIFENLLNDPQANYLKDALYFWTAEVHFKGSNFEKAAMFYQKLLDDFPASTYLPAAYYSLGWSFSQIGKYSQALEIFNNLLIKFPDEPQGKDANFKIIECLYNLRKYTELKDKIKPIFNLYSNDALRLPYLYFYLAESEFYLDSFEPAAKNYLKSIELFREQKSQSLAKLGLGWSDLKMNKYKEAEEVLMDIKPDSLDKKNLDILILGQALLMSATNRTYEAKRLYEQLISISSDPSISLQAYIGQGSALYNLSEYGQAVNVYEKALTRIKSSSPQNFPAELINKLRYNLALAYLKQGQLNSGIIIFEDIIEKSSDPETKINMFFEIGSAYEQSELFKKAEDVYSKVLNLYPNSTHADYAQYHLGSLQLKMSNYEQAAESFKSIIKNYPKSRFLADAVYSLGVTYFQKADYVLSYEIFSKFQNEFKNSLLRAKNDYMLGLSLVNLEKFNEALGVFKDILRLYPQEIELKQRAEYQIADCYSRLGQENEAVDRFKLLRTKYPDSNLAEEIMWWLGQYYYKRNDLKLARRYFDSITKDYANSNFSAGAYYFLGLISSYENKFKQAADNFNQAIKFGNPGLSIQSAVALGDLYNRIGRFEEATRQYKKVLVDKPELGKVLFSRIAEANYKLANYEEAKLFYDKSLQVADPKEQANIHFNLAEVLETNLEPDAAIKEYNLAADLYLDNPQSAVRALLRVAKLYEDKEELVQALQVYQQIIQKSTQESKFAQERIDWIKANQ